MKYLIATSLSIAVLSGCAGGPVGWGGTHEVLGANDKVVTYRYDPLVGGRSSAANAASAHCSGYGKTAIPTMRGNEGIIQIQTYECRSPQGSTTVAEAKSQELSNKMKSGFEGTKKCTNDLVISPMGQQVTKSILVMAEDQPNKFDLFGSKGKVNEQQRKLLREFLGEQAKCRKQLVDAAAGTAYAVPIAKRYAESDALYAKLLTGQISIGEANLSREQSRIQSSQEMAAVAKSLDDSFRQSHNSEIAHDDESRRRLAEAYRANQQAQQQQQIINQNQQIINNQIQQNMKPPAPRTPIQTDCYRMGNSVSCTSQ